MFHVTRDCLDLGPSRRLCDPACFFLIYQASQLLFGYSLQPHENGMLVSMKVKVFSSNIRYDLAPYSLYSGSGKERQRHTLCIKSIK